MKIKTILLSLCIKISLVKYLYVNLMVIHAIYYIKNYTKANKFNLCVT